MIRIFSSPAGAFLPCPLVGVNEGHGSLPSTFFQPLIGPFNPDTGDFIGTELMSYKGEINTSPKSDMGERNCLHRKPDGDIFIPNFSVVTPVEGYETSYISPRSTGGYLQYSCIAVDGTDQIDYVNVENGTQFHSRFLIKGRNVFAGYISYEMGSKWKYLSVSFKQLTFSQDWKKYTVLDGPDFNRKSDNAEYNYFLHKLLHEDVTTLSTPSVSSGSFVYFKESPQILDGISLKRITNLVKNHGLYDPMAPNDLRDIWGRLAQGTADQLDYCPVNVIQFLRELREWRTLIPKVSKVLSPKTWSNWFLSYRYGLTLTWKDSVSIVQSLKDSLKESIHYMDQKPKILYAVQSIASVLGKRNVDSVYRYKVICDRYPSVVMNIVREMKQWGIYPTLLNAWDMIPYSFVVDWFVSVDDLFQQLDARIFWQYFKVLSVCRSQKHTTVFSGKDLLPTYPVIGSVRFTYYHREVRRHMDLPRIVLDTPSGFRNYAELTALIVQRKR